MNSLSQFVATRHAKAVKMPLGEWLAKTDDTIIVEPKWDGRRVFLFKSSEVVLASKHNGVYTKEQYPELFSKFHSLRGDRIICDGEFLPKVQQLKLFDILEVNGEDCRPKPLAERKLLLQFVARDRDLRTAWDLAHTQGQIERMKDLAIQDGFEGVMCKKAHSKYGESDAWVKLKKFDDLDAIILRRNVKGGFSWSIGVYDNGLMVELCDVGSFVKDVDPNQIQVGDVVEVQFQEITKDRKLRHAFITRKRLDKIPTECRIEQIV